MEQKNKSAALTMTYAEKQARAEFKRRTLLSFLASGEVWTTLTVVAQLLNTTERTALRLLQSLVAEHLLKVDIGIVPHSNLKLYGITAHGLAVCDTSHDKCKEFAIGRTNPSFVTHHLQSQLVRICMERAGWTDFVPGKLLYSKSSKGQKIPDFLASRPDSKKVAGEIERYCKSPKRMADVIGGHLQQIVAGKYDFVYYFVPNKAAQQRAFDRVDFVVVDSNKIKLNESHRARFKIFEIESYKGEM